MDTGPLGNDITKWRAADHGGGG